MYLIRLFLLSKKTWTVLTGVLCVGLIVFSVSKPVIVSALTQQEQEAQWQAELASTEADIAKWQAVLDTSKKNTACPWASWAFL